MSGDNQIEVMRCAQLGLMEPIDAYLPSEDLTDIWESAMNNGQVDNQHYLWPLYNHALVILVNESLCAERGVAHLLPKEDEDWDIPRFLKVAHALTFDRDGNGHTNVYGVGFCGLGDVQYLYTTWIANFGGRVFDRKQGLILNSPSTIEGLQFLRSLSGKEGVAPTGATGYRITDLADQFFGQKVGMMLGSAGFMDYGKLQVQTGRVRPFRWRLVSVPVAHKGEHCVSYLTVGAVGVSRQTDPAHREAAMALARYIASPELNHWFWAQRASPYRSTPLPEDQNMRVMMKLVQHAQDFLLPPVALNPRYDLQRQLDLFYQQIFSTDVPIETALAEFTEKFNREALKDVKNWPSIRDGTVQADL
jgi:ABC-type glycerol-3-phosphate transport system substrate-binding protein